VVIEKEEEFINSVWWDSGVMEESGVWEGGEQTPEGEGF